MSVQAEQPLIHFLRAIPARRALGVLGFALLGFFAVAAVLHNSLAAFPRGEEIVVSAALPPSLAHPFGTDQLGRDVMSEAIHALGITMGDAGVAFAAALIFGTLLGIIAAHLFGAWGVALRLVAGVAAAVPVLLLAVLLVVLTGYAWPAFAAGFAAAPLQFARSFDRTRALLSGRQADYARASGITRNALLRRDLSHTLAASLTGLAGRAFASVTVTLATLSFFGFGAAPPFRDLGLMIASARPALDAAWWAAVFPAAILAAIVLAASLAPAISADEP